MTQMGRPSRGKRTQFVIRVPEYLGDAIKTEAQEEQTSLTDYLGRALAQHLGLPVPAPAPRGPGANSRPVAEAAELPLSA